MYLSQAIEIEKQYYLKTIPADKFSYERIVITLPEEYKELNGYGLFVEANLVAFTENSIIIYRGQERKEKKSVYVIEKIAKEKGKRFQKYRLEKDKLQAMYDSVPHPGVEYERTLRCRFKHKSGKLLYVSQTLHYNELMPWRDDEQRFGWVVEFDDEPNACYVLYYDWLTGRGKITNDNIAIIHEYKFKDLSVIWDNAREVEKLLKQYDKYKDDKSVNLLKKLIGININV